MAARLAYAVAFQAVRDVLVLDEIFAVGDAGFREKCEARYRELHARGHTVVLVSHNPLIVADFCTRALLIDNGRIAFDGDAAAVAANYCDRLTSGRGAAVEPLFAHP
jgi:ABC-type polysaccharide/polyol phosphate transport system ATPase subunit